MKKEDFIMGLGYLIVVVLILNLIFAVATYKASCELMKVMEAHDTYVRDMEYLFPFKFATETSHNAHISPVEAPETAIVPEVVYYDVPLDEGVQDHIFMVCEDYGIDPALIVSMIGRESGYREDAVGDSGKSLGLMQIQPRWHKDRMNRLGCDDLLDPYQNVEVGIDLFAELLNQSGSVEWALMAYNGGPTYANKKLAQGKVSEYAQTVMYTADGLTRS